MNKVNVQKTAAKKRQAFSYQQPNFNTLQQTDKKIKLDLPIKSSKVTVPETADDEPIVLSANFECKTNLKNFCVPCQKVVPSNMSQHKKGQKHKDNEYV